MDARIGTLALLAVVACGGAEDTHDYDTAEGAKRVQPEGDENLGSLLVTLPTNFPAEAPKARVVFEGQNIALGVVTRMIPAKGCLTVGGAGERVQVNKCGVEVKKGRTTRVRLSALELQFDESTLWPDVGPDPDPAFWHRPGAPLEEERFTFNQLVSDPPEPVLVPDGEYRFSFGIPNLTDLVKSVAPGQILKESLGVADKRAALRIRKATRELPNAPYCAKAIYVVSRQGAYGGSGDPLAGILDLASYSGDEDHVVHMYPYLGAGAAHYEVVVHDMVEPVDIKLGRAASVKLERIDVDDVVITTETGEKRKVQGTWQIFRSGARNSWVPTQSRDESCQLAWQMNFPTQTGIDVLPGKYKVVVSFATAEGNQTKEHVVTVP